MKTTIVVCTYLLMVASCFAHDYSCTENRACRCSASNSCDYDGSSGDDDVTKSECKRMCDDDSNCQGYEWTNNGDNNDHCEIHFVRGNNFSGSDQNRDNTECCWRVTSSSGGSMSSKGGRRLDGIEIPRRHINRRTRDRATGRKLRRHALRVGQKMDASNAWE
mmetsp:Transcript_17338/g.28831  ORF Transcript_17338/g.28831 Transcript_17338/m.28831 type:complete len:163 (-) Transcript_17338:197-685(-)|eukprot:CAMPEP_0197719728 /NCGR_PEP_ID=MMETSP1434-20131217/3360_1 /TAXON_ID=265543 /ORGANISM="Minutocellus polymorphus, Strain CCMP3303" /LENGTH=162 /DNA_ID=CAMNT_0043304495 /DNA_START=125 /DNA_END=613 /DNA_ORIENTATION=-